MPVYFVTISLAFWRPNLHYRVFVSLLAVQVHYNIKHNDNPSISPSAGLDENQINWSITHYKYATYLGGGNTQNFCPSPHKSQPNAHELDWTWYYKKPIAATKLLTLKTVGAMLWDFVEPYPTGKAGRVGHLSIFVIIGYLASFWQIFQYVATLGSTCLHGLFCTFSIGCWACVHMLTALELRFTLPIWLILTLVAVKAFEDVFANDNVRYKIAFGLYLLVFSAIIFTLALHVGSTARI